MSQESPYYAAGKATAEVVAGVISGIAGSISKKSKKEVHPLLKKLSKKEDYGVVNETFFHKRLGFCLPIQKDWGLVLNPKDIPLVNFHLCPWHEMPVLLYCKRLIDSYRPLFLVLYEEVGGEAALTEMADYLSINMLLTRLKLETGGNPQWGILGGIFPTQNPDFSILRVIKLVFDPPHLFLLWGEQRSTKGKPLIGDLQKFINTFSLLKEEV